MSKFKIPSVVIIHEGPDWEEVVKAKPLTEQDIKDNLPKIWKDRARVAQTSKILMPIKGSGHYA